MKNPGNSDRSGPLELVEEAAHLLRHGGLQVLSVYYAGAVPFALALLFYGSDMARDAWAWQRLPGASLLVAVSYLWMSVWMALFANRLRALLSGHAEPLTFWRLIRLCRQQATVQPAALVVLPFAAITVLPFLQTFAFFPIFSTVADGQPTELRVLVRKAARLSRLWPMQRLVALLVIAGLSIVLFINIVVALYFLPELWRIFTGLQSRFVQAGVSVLGSTLLWVCLALTWLCIDPLVRAVYALHAFHGESQHTGDDLRAVLRWSGASVLLLLAGGLTGVVQAAPVTQPELDRAIDDVLRDRRFSWTLPRQLPTNEEPNALVRFTDNMLESVRRALHRAARAFGRFLRWLDEKLMPGEPPRDSLGSPDAPRGVRPATYAFLAILLGLGLWLAWKSVSRGRTKPPVVVPAAAIRVDAVAAEANAADLSAEEWIELSTRYLEQQDYRMAIRTRHLALLAVLGNRELLLLTRAKSNLDYCAELRRRAPGQWDLHRHFAAAAALLERVWYGRHPAGPAEWDQFGKYAGAVLEAAPAAASETA